MSAQCRKPKCLACGGAGGAGKKYVSLEGRDASGPESERRQSIAGTHDGFSDHAFFVERMENMEEERIGFIGIVIDDLPQAPRVNQVISQYQHMVTGRIGVPDHSRSMAVIGLLVRGQNNDVGAFTAKLGNIPGVQVKSAMTKSERKE